MRNSLNNLDISGEVVIGEGERDKAPMLYIGEKVGNGKGPEVDIALDPLEGTTICATGGNNALTVIAFSSKGGFLNAPDVYMDKIAVGGWLETSEQDIEPFVESYHKEGIKYVICTDISKDGMLEGPAFELYQSLLEQVKVKLIASGGISKFEELLKINVFLREFIV